MMHYVVTWEGYSRFLDQHVKRHVPPQLCLIRGICKACEVDERRLREGL